MTEVRPTARAAASFGAQLALTHDSGAPFFGSPPGWSGDGFIVDVPLSLQPRQRWGEFFAEQRVLTYARQARRPGSLAGSGFVVIEGLAERIGAGDFEDPAPPPVCTATCGREMCCSVGNR